ncbi:MAG: HEAT repeat domain-containing protein [Candidatus Acidiferrales bacterium]
MHKELGLIVALMFFMPARGGAQAPAPAQTSAATDQSARNEAWDLLRADYAGHHAGTRAPAVSVLGLLPGDARAEGMAAEALKDEKADVRAAAATALGMMRARRAISRLREAVDDPEPAVALAAANSLLQLGDDEGYDMYYAVLTGSRKGHPGLISEQTKKMHDPKKMAEVGFEEGIGFVPFAGLGWDVLKTVLKNDNTPVRAAAAKRLASDPDPKTAEALVSAASDKSWIVRAAALEAIALRDDPALLSEVVPYLADPRDKVRLVAAACVIRLTNTAAARGSHKK